MSQYIGMDGLNFGAIPNFNQQPILFLKMGFHHLLKANKK